MTAKPGRQPAPDSRLILTSTTLTSC